MSENFQFLVVKFSIYLNRRVFVMETALSAEGFSPMADNVLGLIHRVTTNNHVVSVHHRQKSAS